MRERVHERETITRVDATWNADTTRGGPHPQGTHTEGRTPQDPPPEGRATQGTG